MNGSLQLCIFVLCRLRAGVATPQHPRMTSRPGLLEGVSCLRSEFGRETLCIVKQSKLASPHLDILARDRLEAVAESTRSTHRRAETFNLPVSGRLVEIVPDDNNN